ncbi:MAG: amidohydrolase family protein [Nevskia sp.]|nr:amidohydrolase family protein [Nevskia sp.]
MADFDLIIHGGTIVDGQRTPRFAGDIGIKDGKVAAITGAGGLSKKTADKNINAQGLIVAPGFVDLHTHYDAQIFWDPYCSTGGWHGITSVVIGNCGFGLAPVTPELRERAMLALTRNEAVSYQAMKVGLPWNWETFPQYLDAIEQTPKGVNVLAYVPLTPVLTLAMGGTDAAKARRPNAGEMTQMKQIISEAMDAGACGLSAQRLGTNSIQRDYDGTPTVTDVMHLDDFLDLCAVLKDKGRGAVQVLGLTAEETERVCEVSGASVIYNVVALECDQHGMKTHGAWESFTDWMEDANRRGLRVSAQTVITGIDYEFTFEDWNLYDYSPHWRELCMGSVAQKIEKMKDAARRAAVRREYDELMERTHGAAAAMNVEGRDMAATETAATPLQQFITVADNAVILVECEELERYEGMTIRQIAEQENKHPCDTILDIAVADELRTTFATPPNQYNLQEMQKLLLKPYTIPGVSDGGAHMKFAVFGRYPTEYLVNYVRDNKLVDLEYAHWHLSAVPALYAGLIDRGVIRIGAPADIVVYDMDELGWTPAEKAYDMPAGDWRRVTHGIGYRYTIVNGQITFIDGECTNATPGVLLRHGHA